MYIGVIYEKFMYGAKIINDILYKAAVDNIKAAMGRLKHYDNAQLKRIDSSTLEYLENLSE